MNIGEIALYSIPPLATIRPGSVPVLARPRTQNSESSLWPSLVIIAETGPAAPGGWAE